MILLSWLRSQAAQVPKRRARHLTLAATKAAASDSTMANGRRPGFASRAVEGFARTRKTSQGTELSHMTRFLIGLLVRSCPHLAGVRDRRTEQGYSVVNLLTHDPEAHLRARPRRALWLIRLT